MSKNLPTSKEEDLKGAKDFSSVPRSEPGQTHNLRRLQSKASKPSDPHKNTSPPSSSPLSSPESRDRRKDRRNPRPRKRSRRPSRSPSWSEDDIRSRSNSTSRKPKEHHRGLKGGLVALGGLLAAGLPIAGELYLKHMVHEHEREKDERKEIRHEQAMEEKERKKMDLELEAMEEETGWMSRKHEIDIRRREVDLQIREMELDGMLIERKPRGRKVIEGCQDRATRADILSIEEPRGRQLPTIDSQPQSYRAPNEDLALARDVRYQQDSPRDLVYPDELRRRKYDDAYLNPRSLHTHLPPEQAFRPPRRSRRERSSSTDSQTQRRSASPPPARLRAFPTTTALVAGGLTAYRLRDDDGPWLGKKAARIATSAGTAALTSLTLKRDETPPEEDEGLVAQILDSRPFAVAGPVMAGIGAERIIWGRNK